MSTFLLSVLALAVISAGWFWFERRWDQRLFAAAPGELYKNLRPAAAMKLLKERGDVQVLDVRSNAEFSRGALPNARHISIGDLDFRERISLLDTTKPVLVYCAGGYRSRKAIAVLRELHFNEVYNLHRGYHSWRIAGQPVVKPTTD